jgi:anti-anti-sigma factor
VQARVTYEGAIVIIQLIGRLDVETAEPFRAACLNQLHERKVVFDFHNLSFVGSSGILPFLETMQEFARANVTGFNFSGVGSEFRKVFAATPLNHVDIFDTHKQAVRALLDPQSRVAVAPLAGESPTAVVLAPVTEENYISLKHDPEESGEGGVPLDPDATNVAGELS